MKKVALVTGGSKGIGKAIVYALAESGYHVIVHYNTSKKEADKIAMEVKGTSIKYDFKNFNNLNAFVNKIKSQFSSLDCIVHNAGIADEDYLKNLTENCFDQHININLKIPVFLTKHFFNFMNDKSAIIFISSGCATYSTPEALSYAMSKAGIEIFAKSIYSELAPKTRVNVVAAGATETDMYQKNYTANDKEWVKNNNPMGGPRTPQEIANMVAFLVSDKASGVTGQIIRVNGGSHT